MDTNVSVENQCFLLHQERCIRLKTIKDLKFENERLSLLVNQLLDSYSLASDPIFKEEPDAKEDWLEFQIV